ncbi:MAG: hypothetical protein ACRDI1_06500 [Actinomycetota bacterium]
MLIYLAAKEAGVALDLKDERTKDFFRANVMRPFDARLTKTGVKAGDGYWDSLASGRIPDLIAKLREHFS